MRMRRRIARRRRRIREEEYSLWSACLLPQQGLLQSMKTAAALLAIKARSRSCCLPSPHRL
jgi:hypothetical protein